MIMNSPFRYPGGKFYARKLLLPLIIQHTTYIEPFAGGASVFFAKDKAQNNWLNDADEDLFNMYLHIRDHVEELVDFLEGIPATKERHGYFKNEFIPQNDLQRAGRWYYLNRTSYSGIMKRENCYWGYGDKYSMRPENWPRNLRRTSKKLQGVKITCRDFEEVLLEAEDGSFLFIDPPYFNADQDKFYSCAFSRLDHLRLARLLREHSGRLNFLLTYDNVPEIRKMYSWANEMLDREWNYTINRTDDQKANGDKSKKGERYKGKEVFVINYEAKELRQLEMFE